MLVVRVSFFNFPLSEPNHPQRWFAACFRLFVRIGNNAKRRHERGQKNSGTGLSCLMGTRTEACPSSDSGQLFRGNTAPSAFPYKLAPESRVQFASSGLPTGFQRFHISGDIPPRSPRSFSCVRKRYNVTLPIREPPGREGEIPTRGRSCSCRPVGAGRGD
jgi:hypothetical protein